MKFAIIAAGEGSRLAAEGVPAPKPLVSVGGERLVDRLLRIFSSNGAEEVVVVCNDCSPQVAEHLSQIQKYGLCGHHIPLRFVVKSTPSSMHSFHEIAKWLRGGPFVLTTVDTVFNEGEFGEYLRQFQKSLDEGFDGLMGVTEYVDDEKPLWVKTDESQSITGFYDSNSVGCEYVSAGIYGLTQKSLGVLDGCVKRGMSRMRNFQRSLLDGGLRLKAYPFTKVIDIDHLSDINKAETLLQ